MIDSAEEADALARTRAVSRICACCSLCLRSAGGALADALLEDPSLPHCQALLSPLGMDDALIQSVYNLLDTLRWRESRILSQRHWAGRQHHDRIADGQRAGGHHAEQAALRRSWCSASLDSTGESRGWRCQTFAVQHGAGGVQGIAGRNAGRHGQALLYRLPHLHRQDRLTQSQGRDAFAWFIAYAPF